MTDLISSQPPGHIPDHLVVLTTCDSQQSAATLARALVDQRLAACVNIVPNIRSIYRWQGKFHDDTEFLLVIKTRRDRFDALKVAIEQLHTYDVPEVIALPIVDGSAPYLAWLDGELDAELPSP